MNFEKLDSFLNSLSDMYGIPGCDISVSLEGRSIFRQSYGFDSYDFARCTDRETAYQLYSVSKVLTTCCALKLIEDGKLSLKDPISKHLPSYSCPVFRTASGTEPCDPPTVEQLMAMQGGFDYDINAKEILDEVARTNGQATTRQIIDALAKRPLIFRPGTYYAYSLCHDVLGAVIEEASGMRFRDYAYENILFPLGITELRFHRNELSKPEKSAALWCYDDANRKVFPVVNEPIFIFTENYDSGGAGLCGTCDAYMTFAEALANGKILRPETVKDWSTSRLTEKGHLEGWAPLCKQGYGYGLGVRTRTVDDRITPLGEFGWDGAAGSYVLIDTKTRLAVVFMINVLGCNPNAFIQDSIRKLVYEAIK